MQKVDVMVLLLRLVRWAVHCFPFPVVAAAFLACHLSVEHVKRMRARTLARGLLR